MDLRSLSEEDLKFVRCSKCSRYLSHAPITFDMKGAMNCGRCVPSSEDSFVRITQYEILANYFEFSCIFDLSGCTRKIKFGDVPDHEAACDFNVAQCPVEHCPKSVCLKKINVHFVEKHSDLVSKNSRFAIPQKENIPMSKILNLDGQNVLLQIRPTCKSTEKLDLALGFLTKVPDAESFKYKIRIFSTKGSKSFNIDMHPIGLYKPLWNYQKQNIISIDLNALQSVLGCKQFTFELLVDKSATADTSTSVTLTQSNIMKNISVDLECNICMDSMKPPIYICKTGHSICSTCRKKIKTCPTCQAKYEGARNFQLEELADRNEVEAQNIRFECPLVEKEECLWKGPLEHVFLHVNSEHALYTRVWFNVKFTIGVAYSCAVEEILVSEFDNKPFMVHINKRSKDLLVTFRIEEIGQLITHKSKYEFVLYTYSPESLKIVRTLPPNLNVLIPIKEFLVDQSYSTVILIKPRLKPREV